jgi:sugar lactone lactonase YvrE
VADAGGNSLLRVTQRGYVKLITTFPPRWFNGRLVQSVPTCVEMGPDGAFYVGELGGEGTPQGKARIWRVAPDGTKRVFATGFNTIIDLDFGPDGTLYVAQFLKQGFSQLQQRKFTGALFAVLPDKTRVELAKGQLQVPGGIAVSPDGAKVYVSVYSVLPNDGQVVAVPAF